MGVMDTGGKYVPMLFSNSSLKKSKAIVDFDTGEAVFRAVSDKIVQLEPISSGHGALDVVEDITRGVVGKEGGKGIQEFQIIQAE